VPGFIDEVMHYKLDTAPYPVPLLAFAGSLTLQALLAGRKVRDAMDNRTNLYVLSLANSGVGGSIDVQRIPGSPAHPRLPRPRRRALL
jgi:hypothetical protein